MKTRFNKLTAWLLTLAMLMTFIPNFTLTASAAETYDLWVGGEQVTSENADDVFSDGKVSYDAENKTLTLNNYNYEGEGYLVNDNFPTAIYYGGSETLNLVLEGTSIVTQQSDAVIEESYGIFSEGSITVSGDGSLTVNSGSADHRSCGLFVNGNSANVIVLGGKLIANGGTANNYSYGVFVSNGSFSISDGTVEAHGGTAGISYGIEVNVDVNVSGGSITVTGDTANEESYGVEVTGNINVTGGSLTAKGGEALAESGRSYGICSSEHISISGGDLKGIGSKGNSSYGVHGSSIAVSGTGDLSGVGGEVTGAFRLSVGVNVGNSITVADNGRLTGIGDTSGVYSYGVVSFDTTINGGETIAQGETSAFYSAPTIADTFANAALWCGTDEAEANREGEQPISELVFSYIKKYVKIAEGTPAPEAKWGASADSLAESGTLAEAVAAAASDSSITYIQLQSGVTLGETLNITGGNFTLDLNGQTVSGTASSLFKITDGTVTIDDTSENGKIAGASGSTAIYISGGTLNLVGGRLESISAERNANALYISDSATVNISGGEVYAENTNTNNSPSPEAVSINSANSSLTVSGGSIAAKAPKAESSHAFGIRAYRARTLNITGGSISAIVEGSASNSWATGIYVGYDNAIENFMFSDGSISASGGQRTGGIAFYGDQALTISGGLITLSNAGSYKGAVYSWNQSPVITVVNNAAFSDSDNFTDFYIYGGYGVKVNLSYTTSPSTAPTTPYKIYISPTAERDFTSGWSSLNVADTEIDNYFTAPGSNQKIIKNTTTNELRLVEAYTITFSTGGYGTAPDSQKLLSGEKVTKPEDPVREGYGLNHWCTKHGCSNGTTCENSWDFDNDTVTASDTLYAAWERTHWEVYLNLQGGDCDIDYAYADKLTGKLASLPEATRVGYIFNGWFDSREGGNKITTETVFTDDTRVFAQWTAYQITQQPTADNEYEVIVSPSAGVTYTWHEITETAVTTENADVYEDDGYSSSYTDGWWSYHSTEGMGTPGYFSIDLNAGDTVEVELSRNCEGTVRIQYFNEETYDRYQAYENTNGGNKASLVAPAAAKYDLFVSVLDYGEQPTVKAKVINAGEAISGQTTNKLTDGTGGTKYVAKITYPDGTILTSEAVAYIVPTYTVTLNTNGGIINSGEITSYIAGEETALPTEVSKEGHTFAGWYENKNFTGSAITAIASTDTGDKEYFAKWTVNSYPVTFNAGYGAFADGSKEITLDVEFGTIPVAPEIPVLAGYVFAGWNPALALVTVDGATYTATYAPGYVSYTIEIYTMDTDGNYGAPEKESKMAKTDSTVSVTPENKEGFTVDVDASVLIGTVAADASTVLKVYYMRNQYDFTVEVDGVHDTKTYYYGEAVETPADPTKTGFVFDGWSETVPTTMPARDVTVTAQWTVNKHDIIYMVDGVEYHRVEDVTYGAAITLIDEPTRIGHTFSGWSTAPATMPDADVTVTGTFAINTYTVTFIDYDEEVLATQTVNHGFAATAPQNPTREGWRFTGWDKEFDNVTSDLTVKAQYEEKGTVSITESAQTFTYDNTEKAFDISGTSLAGFAVEYYVEDAWTTAAPKNAGKYNVRITRDEDDTYKAFDKTLEDALIIEKANAVITVDTTPIVKTYGNTWALPTATTNFGAVTVDKTVAEMENAGTYTVTYTVVGTDNYNGDTKTVSVTINPKKIDKPAEDTTSFTYNGNEQTYTVAENAAYIISNNKRTDAGEQTVTVALNDKANYTWADGSTDDVTFTFNIAQKNISGAEITLGTALTYNGNEQSQTVTSVKIDGLDVTYDISGNTATNYNGGGYTLTVTGNGNFTGAATIDWNIARKSVEGATVGTFDAMTYTGNAHTPTATVTIDGLTVTGAWSNVTNVADKTTFTANGNFTGTIENQSTGMLNADSSVTTAPSANALTYSAAAQELVTAGVANGGTLKYSIDNTTWTEAIPAGIDAGNYEVWYKVFGDANHNDTDAVMVAVTIAEKSIEDATVALDGALTYNGAEQTQNVTVTLDGFTVTYDVTDNKATDVKADGNYTLKVTASGNFEGEKTLEWNIAKATPAQNPEKLTTARVRRGQTLANATVTNGEFFALDGTTVLEGTFTWVDDTEAVSEDTTKKMKFTPTDTNYAEIEIDVAVDSYTSGGGSSVTRYTVKFDTDGGSSVSSATVTKNAKVTEPKAPEKDGYTFGGWYTDEELAEKYDFDSKVTKNLTLFAKWDKHDDEQPGTDTHNCPSLAFDDLDITQWYHLDTDYVIENGIFKGTTETTFEPNSAQTRAMMVTVLYRAEGEPAVNRSIPFADVDMGAYYANAVIWGQQNGIIKGYSETEFGPDDKITREQIAAIMHRYAQYKGYDVTVGENTNILSYDDFADISDYAISSMQWACGSGLIKGRTESTLNPKDNATRAEIAAILHRFIEANK